MRRRTNMAYVPAIVRYVVRIINYIYFKVKRR